MSQEIVYTSAPQGLKPGSRGFCTVIATQGMARNLAERLESLSGYRHAYAVHDEHAHLNPVNYSHLKFTVGGQEYSVLSRIGDAGQDYTGRTNKLAHHVALTPSERPPAGPAYQLQQPGFCIEAWDSQTRYTEINCHRLSSDHPPLTQCTSWSRWCDAGWAGVLAESALEGRNQSQTIIYPVEAGSSTLALVSEALQLLPEKQRWEVTFSTYFTKLPAGVDCQWRFVLDGSPEAEAARRNPRVKLIDLCADLGTAPEGPLVASARTGQLNRQMNSASPKAIHVAPPIPSHEIVQQDSTEENVDFPEPASPVPPPVVKTRRAPKPPPLEKHFQKPKKSRKLLIGSSVVLLFVLIAGTVYLLMPGQNEHEQVVQSPKPPTEMKQKIILEKMEKDKIEAAVKKVKRLKPVEKPKQVVSIPQAEMVPEPEPKQVKKEPKKKPLEDVRKIHQGVLQLPSLNKNIGADNKSELTKIYVDDVNDCELSILGSEKVLGDGVRFEIRSKIEKDGIRKWNVIKTTANAISQKGVLVGTFKLKGNLLSFEWPKNREAKDAPERLLSCLLKIDASNDSEKCRLSHPINTNPIKLDFSSKMTEIEFPVDRSRLPLANDLQIIVYVDGIPANGLEGFQDIKIPPHTSLKLNEQYRVSISNPLTEKSEKFLDLVFSFKELNHSKIYGIAIQAEAFGKDVNDTSLRSFTSISHTQEQLKEDCIKHIKMTEFDLAKIEQNLFKQQNLVREQTESIKKIKNDPNIPKGKGQQIQMEQYLFKNYNIRSIQAGEDILKENENKLKKLNTSKETLQNAKVFFTKNIVLCEKLLKLFDQLEKNVTIDYELFIEIEGEKVVIIKTTPDSKKH
ncbi:hypothetical protein CA11_40010 [Gimesia maris]|uniref:GAP1-N2 domain-containing protein n=1 Tax=Gimesia maris TaxID=122 RepID=UPI00118A0372|nr:hypothetical protein [Gimesia maris]QDU16172.1 hypothetical protein CA11_40010 [Gimesia maris]